MTNQLSGKEIAKNRFYAFCLTMPWLIYKERYRDCFLILASYLIVDIIFLLKIYFSPLSIPSKIVDIIPLILTAIFSLLYLFKAKKISQEEQPKERSDSKKARVLIFMLIAGATFPAIEYTIAQIAKTKWQAEYSWFIDNADEITWDLNPTLTQDEGILFTFFKKSKGNNSTKNGLYLIKVDKNYKLIWQTRIEKTKKDILMIKEMPNKKIVVYTNTKKNLLTYEKNRPTCRYYISSKGRFIKKDSPTPRNYFVMYHAITLKNLKNLIWSGIKKKNGIQLDEYFDKKRATISLKKKDKTIWALTLYHDFNRCLTQIHKQKDNTIIISYRMNTKAFTGIVLYKISKQGKLVKTKLYPLPHELVFTYVLEHKNGQKTLIIEWPFKPKIAMVKLKGM